MKSKAFFLQKIRSEKQLLIGYKFFKADRYRLIFILTEFPSDKRLFEPYINICNVY